MATLLTNPNLNWLIILYGILKSKSLFTVWLGILVGGDCFQFTGTPTSDLFTLTPTLLNGLFLIHPICITVVFLEIIRKVWTSTFRYANILLSLPHPHKAPGIGFSALVMTGISGIFLGGWWAYQELGWGGWWSWDAVEIINLVLLTLCLHTAHTAGFLRKTSLATTQSICGLVVFLHLTVRFDLFNSVHSFLTTQVTYYAMVGMLVFVYILTPISTNTTHSTIWRLDHVWMFVLFWGLCIGLLIEILWIGRLNQSWWWVLIYICVTDVASQIYLNWTWSWVLVVYNPYAAILYTIFGYFTFDKLLTSTLHILVIILIVQLSYSQFLYLPAHELSHPQLVNNWADWILSSWGEFYTVDFHQLALSNFSIYPTTGVFSYLYNCVYPFLLSAGSEHMEVVYNLHNWYFYTFGLFILNFKNIIGWFHTKYKKWCII